jgi:hypothetical protein
MDRINLQEFDPDNPHRFMIEVIFTVLRAQALIFANLQDAIQKLTIRSCSKLAFRSLSRR